MCVCLTVISTLPGRGRRERRNGPQPDPAHHQRLRASLLHCAQALPGSPHRHRPGVCVCVRVFPSTKYPSLGGSVPKLLYMTVRRQTENIQAFTLKLADTTSFTFGRLTCAHLLCGTSSPSSTTLTSCEIRLSLCFKLIHWPTSQIAKNLKCSMINTLDC